ncbi:hypothetical protein BH23ACT9_BH23ACT9_25530 [soil metagenome]
MTDDMRTALHDRQQLIEQRAVQLARTALTNGDPWIRQLGPAPTDPHWRRTWLRNLATIAAYRDCHAVTSNTPLGQCAEGMQPPGTRAGLSAVRRVQQAAITDRHRAAVAGPGRQRSPDWSGPSM